MIRLKVVNTFSKQYAPQLKYTAVRTIRQLYGNLDCRMRHLLMWILYGMIGSRRKITSCFHLLPYDVSPAPVEVSDDQMVKLSNVLPAGVAVCSPRCHVRYILQLSCWTWMHAQCTHQNHIRECLIAIWDKLILNGCTLYWIRIYTYCTACRWWDYKCALFEEELSFIFTIGLLYSLIHVVECSALG